MIWKNIMHQIQIQLIQMMLPLKTIFNQSFKLINNKKFNNSKNNKMNKMLILTTSLKIIKSQSKSTQIVLSIQ
jgi:hypothetical protein